MAFFEWNAAISVNQKDIDDQHKVLVKLINDLHEAMSQGKGREIIGKTLDELLKYTQTHFSYEENKLKNMGFVGLTSHKLMHDSFTKQVLDMKDQHQKGKLSITIEVLNFLKDWLVKHIQGQDRKIFYPQA